MKAIKGFFSMTVLAVITLAITTCDTKELLTVENPNEPDRTRALASPEDVEALIAGSYLTFFEATQKSYPGMALSTGGDELTSSWGNWHMRGASTEPREVYDNTPAYRYNNFTETPWYDLYSAISSANDGLAAIADGLQIGDKGEDTPRAKAFAKFVQGASHGFLALFFDKAFVVDETVDVNTAQLVFKPYNEVVDEAIAMLEEAVTLFANNSFTLPDTWINGLELTNEDLEQLAHSYIARYSAWVARDATERASVNWADVIGHARKGITEDVEVMGDGQLWWTRMHHQGQHPIWCRADNNAIGPADTSGNYQAWLATPVSDRMHFLIHTADLRITSGDSATGEGSDFNYEGQPRHRPDRGTYHFSAYAHKRYKHLLDNGAVGPTPVFKATEMDMLIAEGLLRTGGSLDEVADLINKTRVTRGGLPPASGADGAGSPTDVHSVGWGSSPASLWSKMKHEKFIENFAVTAGTGYFERRGWGELISSTPLHWPVPGKELEVLLKEIYTHGGTTGDFAPKVLVVSEDLFPSVH